MKRFLSLTGQSLIEYSIILVVVTVALFGMQVYMRRGLQAVVKSSADQLGGQQGAQVLINFKRQTSSDSVSRASRSGSVATGVSRDGTQTKDTSITSTSIGSTTSVSQE